MRARKEGLVLERPGVLPLLSPERTNAEGEGAEVVEPKAWARIESSFESLLAGLILFEGFACLGPAV